MKTIKFNLRKTFLYAFSLVFFLGSNTILATFDPIQEKANQTLSELYSDNAWRNLQDNKKRLAYISKKFLGYPYVLNGLGDGIDSSYDQFPLYRFDGFDCETYVATMLSLALAKNPEEFKQTLRRIRYIDEKNELSYFARNHFIELDWNMNNANKGIVKDITQQIFNKQGQAIYKIAHTVIDRPAWVQKMDEKILRLRKESSEVLPKRLQQFRAAGKHLKLEISNLPYLPISAIDDTVLAQIPNVSIIEIVRPDWDVKWKLGTNINVSHMGLAIWKKGKLMFREASSLFMKTVDVPLIDYLHEQAVKNPSVKGINVQIINEYKK